MKAKETMIAWTPADHTTNPTHGQVECGPWPDVTGWSDEYACTDLACWRDVKAMSEQELQLLCFIIAMHMVTKFQMNPTVVDAEMQKVDEYRSSWSMHPANKIGFL